MGDLRIREEMVEERIWGSWGVVMLLGESFRDTLGSGNILLKRQMGGIMGEVIWNAKAMGG